jgi:predicted lipoprotein with Yx(FWY)xxD motif
MERGSLVRHGKLAASILLSTGLLATGFSAPALGATHQTSMTAKGTKIATVVTKKYGRILANTKGRVMYLHTTDKGTVSKCPGACATAWPKVTSKAKPLAGKGINAKHLKRNSKGQVTYYGHPLYYFATGKAKGNTSGEDVFDFFVVGTNGKAIRHAKPKPATGPTGPAEVTTGTVGTTQVITTRAGRTLYALTAPNEKKSFSCTSACMSNWIPLLTKGAPTVGGAADSGVLGTVTRGGIGTQVTYGGFPVYRFVGDTAAGQDNGKGDFGPLYQPPTYSTLQIWDDVLPTGATNPAA